jgi:small-conductance mechanosensitive channel
MSPLIIRTIIALILLVVMVYQAIHAPKGSYRRHAFSTAAIALAVLATSNVATAPGGLSLTWIVASLWVVALLFFASLVLLGLAWRSGEMSEQVERMREAFANERTRREKEDAAQANPEHHPDATETTPERETDREPKNQA